MTLVLGIDVGGTKILGVLIDADEPNAVLAQHRVPTAVDSPERLVAAIGEVVSVLRQSAATVDTPERGRDLANRSGLAHIGVGIPGLVHADGHFKSGPHLPGVSDVPLGSMIADHTGLPTAITNDGNCAALAEHATGAATGVENMVAITLGTGIGGGLVIDGALRLGAQGFAAEPGHMVIHPDGPPCPCGRAGCWERFASGTGLGRLGRDAAVAGRLPAAIALAGDAEAVRGEHVTRAALDGDPEALMVIEDFARWLALGLANVANLLDPEMIVLGGGVISSAELFLPATRVWFERFVMAADLRAPILIEPASLGERAGAIGAGLLGEELGPSGLLRPS